MLQDAIDTNQQKIDSLRLKIEKAKLKGNTKLVIELCKEKLQKHKELRHLKSKR